MVGSLNNSIKAANRPYTGYKTFSVNNAVKTANRLLVMSKKGFLRVYIEEMLSHVGLDMTDLEYIGKYGIVSDKEREEEKRKQRDLGNLK